MGDESTAGRMAPGRPNDLKRALLTSLSGTRRKPDRGENAAPNVQALAPEASGRNVRGAQGKLATNAKRTEKRNESNVSFGETAQCRAFTIS
jgi:hypothetical protein